MLARVSELGELEEEEVEREGLVWTEGIIHAKRWGFSESAEKVI